MTLHLSACERVPRPFRTMRNIDEQAAYAASLPPRSERRAKAEHVLQMMRHAQLEVEMERPGFAARRAAKEARRV